MCLTATAAKIHVSAGDLEAAPGAFAVATFVPAHADIGRFLKEQTAFGLRNILIDMSPANELRIRNAWVRGSNPLCAPASLPRTSIDVHKTLENTGK
jgi:hypothetical protein